MTIALQAEPPPEDPDLRFPSLAALREAHTSLLERRGGPDTPPEFLQEIESFLHSGRTTGALLDAASERRIAQSLLDYWANLLYRLNRRVVPVELDEFDPKLAPTLADSDCPYVGLNAFCEEDHNRFFGRQSLIEHISSQVMEKQILAVVGPSGSGKSSLVLGGLLPCLKAGAVPGSERWHYLPRLVPGSDPFRNLAAVVLPPGSSSEEIARLAKQLVRDPSYLAELAAGDHPWVFIIDQFEEIFTLSRNEESVQAFAQSLRNLVEAPGSRHVVVLTLRSDYETQVARLRALQPIFAKAEVRVPPLNAVELRQVIEKPAEIVGLRFEEGLIDKLVYDLLGDPAGLPLLQFTLLKLWEQRNHNWVTWAAYRELGSGREALARSAHKLFEENLSPAERVTGRRILLRMVRPSASLEVTSNRVRREILYQMEDQSRVERVLEKLLEARLVRLTAGETAADVQVEIAHEALVRNWEDLVKWLDEERTQMVLRDRWEAQAEEWVRLGRGESGLMEEPQLSQVEEWLTSVDAKSRLGYSPKLPELVSASREFIKRKKEEADAAHEREKTKLRWFAGILAVLLIATIIVSFFYAHHLSEEKTSSEQLRFKDKGDAVAALVRERGEKDKAQTERDYEKNLREQVEAGREEDRLQRMQAQNAMERARDDLARERKQAGVEKAQALRDVNIAQNEKAQALADKAKAENEKTTALAEKAKAENEKTAAVIDKIKADSEKAAALADKAKAESDLSREKELRAALVDKAKVDADLLKEKDLRIKAQADLLQVQSERAQLATDFAKALKKIMDEKTQLKKDLEKAQSSASGKPPVEAPSPPPI